jgi:hypothetical protein
MPIKLSAVIFADKVLMHAPKGKKKKKRKAMKDISVTGSKYQHTYRTWDY